ncbi:hypothetical protein M0R45_035778 [Rubus argutus]|uniref:Uncharacterized protein n=1 Tax=Rubus argutus TaxID=59490 RepID=A0AAW1VX09_RUBAR
MVAWCSDAVVGLGKAGIRFDFCHGYGQNRDSERGRWWLGMAGHAEEQKATGTVAGGRGSRENARAQSVLARLRDAATRLKEAAEAEWVGATASGQRP